MQLTIAQKISQVSIALVPFTVTRERKILSENNTGQKNVF